MGNNVKFKRVFSHKSRNRTQKMEDAAMKKLANFLKKLWKDESGQGATEYILLLVVIVGLVLMFGPKIQEIIKGKVGELGNMIDQVKPN